MGGSESDSDEIHYCPECGKEVRVGYRVCPHCGEELPEVIRGADDGFVQTSQESVDSRARQAGRPSTEEMVIPDHFGHLFGDVYYDQRWYYGAFEVFAGALILIPSDMLFDLFNNQLAWVGRNYPDIVRWLIVNHEWLGAAFLFASFTGRITIDPDRVAASELD